MAKFAEGTEVSAERSGGVDRDGLEKAQVQD